METTDYCSYELSKALKAAGFDEPCDHYYTPNKALHIVKSNALAPEITNNRFLDEIDDGCCTAVPLWQAQKWLREKHDIHIQIEAVMQKQWTYTLVDTAPLSDMYGEWHDRIPEDREGYPQISTYECALSAGIASALQLLDNAKK